MRKPDLETALKQTFERCVALPARYHLNKADSFNTITRSNLIQ